MRNALISAALICTAIIPAFGQQSVPQKTDVPTNEAAQNAEADTAQWQGLKNQYGWSIKFPKGWIADAIGGDTDANISDSPRIWGPAGCNDNGGRCADIGVDAMPRQTDEMSKLTPQEYLFPDGHHSKPVFSQKELQIDGSPAYEVCDLTYNVFDWPQGVSGCTVVVKHAGKLLKIGFMEWELGNHNASIRSPSDWKYYHVFEEMLLTFRFIPPKRQ
ncbi:MAG: PsbP-related protein [Terriglobales bacterium]